MAGRKSKSKGYRGEREVAALLGVRRTPLSGGAGGNDLDTRNSAFSQFGVEVKRRERLPVLVTDALAQAKAAAPDLEPIVVMREDDGPWLVVLDLLIFKALVRDAMTHRAGRLCP